MMKKTLFEEWFCKYGFPVVVHGDNESSFVSEKRESSANRWE